MKKKVKKKKVKKITVGRAKKKAWCVFSQFIRLRDCLLTKKSIKRGICCTCDHVVEYKFSQAGYFIPGRGGSILFLEDNVHLQCAGCNIYKHGNLIEYGEFMKRKYGEKRVAELIALRHETHQWKVVELQEIEEKYKQKVEKILKSV